MFKRIPWRLVSALAIVAAFLVPTVAMAAPPVVKAVPWVATNPLIAHDTYAGKAITLKGTSDTFGATITYRWSFGDGAPDATGTVSSGNMYALEATHVYAGSPGDIFAATLTVTNADTAESGSATYLIQMRARSLDVEANIAIDQALWYLHKTLYRYSGGGKDYGSWVSGCGGYACAGYESLQGANVAAFFVNGHRVDGSASNPYTETVQRAMRRYFELIDPAWGVPASKTYYHGLGTINADCTSCPALDPSKNALSLTVVNNMYEAGMFASALAASGTPTAVADTGNANVTGRTYRAILQDLVDWFVQAQNSNNTGGFGAWHYNSEQGSADNSTAQWGAIVLLGAEGFGKGQYNGMYGYVTDPGIQIPEEVRQANPYWLPTTFYTTGTGGIYGYFLYSPGYNPWSVWATTTSGLVQLALDRMGRGSSDPLHMWDKTEKYIHDNFTGAGGGLRDYYYGLYAFVKAMLLHVNGATALKEPITLLGGDLDWYAAEMSKGAAGDGVARVLVNRQAADGYWWGYAVGSGEQQYFHTSWAIQMLNRTVTESGAPVAVAKAIPNPAVTGGQVTLDGTASFHQDPTKSIVKWEWDIGNDGTYDLTGPVVLWTAPSSQTNVQIKLRVTDNFGLGTTATTILTVEVSIPPLAPTADAGGPYNFCPAKTPWFLDGSKSVNPDEGAKDPTCPGCLGDTIVSWAWDLNNDGVYSEIPNTKIPDVTSYFAAKAVGSYLIRLKVTDRTSVSFPGHADLFGTDSGQVNVLAANDPKCAGCTVLTARAAGRQVQLNWTDVAAAGYAIYRGTINGGPYVRIAQVLGTQRLYIDQGLTVGATYYWVVRPLTASLEETCQSNQVTARIAGR
ncbi:MAG: hypothetical protein NTV05_18260 [Acidobacteria bacterium]|nr:hypothetical protein [Acidobacteriota bacterium]